jgi:hypothetical protein
MVKNLLHCETGFGVYRSTQLGHIPFFLLLHISVGWPKYRREVVHKRRPSIRRVATHNGLNKSTVLQVISKEEVGTRRDRE